MGCHTRQNYCYTVIRHYSVAIRHYFLLLGVNVLLLGITFYYWASRFIIRHQFIIRHLGNIIALLSETVKAMEGLADTEKGDSKTERRFFKSADNRSPSLGAYNSHTKPMSRHFYRAVYF